MPKRTGGATFDNPLASFEDEVEGSASEVRPTTSKKPGRAMQVPNPAVFEVQRERGTEDKDVHRRLRHAAWKGDLPSVQKFVQRGGDVNRMDGDNFSPLLIACRWGRLPVVKFLVQETDADIAALGAGNQTCYDMAVCNGHDQVASFVLSKGCPVGSEKMALIRDGVRPNAKLNGVQLSTPLRRQESKDEEKRTLWVGGIPAALVADSTCAVLRQMFSQFGTIASVTPRQKPGARLLLPALCLANDRCADRHLVGENASWAFICYKRNTSVTAACDAATTLRTPGGDRRNTGVLLRVKKADIEQELFLNEQKGTEGALASVWKRRAPLNEEMVRIQRARLNHAYCALIY